MKLKFRKVTWLGTLILGLLMVSSGCAERPAITTPTQPNTAPGLPAIGEILPIQITKGTGNGWDVGIRLSDTKFTFGILDMDYMMPPFGYKKGEPAIYFSGTITNGSDKDWYTGYSTVEVVTLAYYGIAGISGLFLPAGTSHSFDVPLSYKPDLTTITVNIGVAEIPWP